MYSPGATAAGHPAEAVYSSLAFLSSSAGVDIPLLGAESSTIFASRNAVDLFGHDAVKSLETRRPL